MESWLRRASSALEFQNSNMCSKTSQFLEEQLVLCHRSKAETGCWCRILLHGLRETRLQDTPPCQSSRIAMRFVIQFMSSKGQ